MKNIILNSATLLVVFALLFTACEEDPIITGDGGGDESEAPTITLLEADGFISKDSEIEVGEAFSVRVEFIAGTADLSSLTILEDGARVDASRISIVGVEIANNPQIITNARGGEFDITIAADPSVMDERFYSYAFTVEDSEKLIGETFLNVTTILPVDPTTPLDQVLLGVLLNQAGPEGTGGLDLDTGMGVGSNAEEAEIQDEGIDFDKTAANNWRQQISGVNGSIMRTVDLESVAEGLTFDKVDNKEQVLAAFDMGATLAGTDSLANPSDDTNDEDVSEPVQLGDLFAVYSPTNDRYYLLECTAINVISDSNGDSYEFNIKY